MDDARKLLDSLMGAHRNVDIKEAKTRKGQNFKESNVCKPFLLGFCPQYEDLFHSTKRDMGKCQKVHSEALKAEFEGHPCKAQYQAEYDHELRAKLEDLVRDADEWVARARRNIQAANKEIEEGGPNDVAKAEIARLNEQAQTLFTEAETFAENGSYEESKRRLELAEEVKRRVFDWEEKARTLRTEDVCDVCGSRMESGDPTRARFRHSEGKIHLGYVKIREWLAQIRARQRADEVGNSSDRRRRGGHTRDRSRSRSGGKDALVERDRRRDDRGRDRERDAGGRARDRAEAVDGEDQEGDRERASQGRGGGERDSMSRHGRNRDARDRDRGRDRRYR